MNGNLSYRLYSPIKSFSFYWFKSTFFSVNMVKSCEEKIMTHQRTSSQLDKKIQTLNLDIAEKGMERKITAEEDQQRSTSER